MTQTDNFEEFMRNYQNMVFSTAMRLLANETDAQDVSQEVFLRAYERYANLKSSPTIGGWLKTVTTNLCLNHLSRYRARWRFFSEIFSHDEDDEAPVEFAAPDTFGERLSEVDQRQMLEVALQKLPPSQRIPLVLYHFEDQSYDEIAARLKISLSKVKTDIFRARETLRKKLRLSFGEELDQQNNLGPKRGSMTPRKESANRYYSNSQLLAPQLI